MTTILLDFNQKIMLKHFLLLFVFILLQSSSFAVGTEGNIYKVSVITTKEKKGIFKKFKEKLILKKINKLAAKIDAFDCDMIATYTGRLLAVNILEIRNNEILYVPCNNQNAEPISLTCREVEFVQLIDGSQYNCDHPDYPKRSPKAFFTKSSDIIDANQQCDILVMVNKDQLNVDVVKIVDDQLFYKTCGDESSSIDSLNLNEIRTYRQKNGLSRRVNKYAFENRDSFNYDGTNSDSNINTLLKILLISLLTLLGLILFVLLLTIR